MPPPEDQVIVQMSLNSMNKNYCQNWVYWKIWFTCYMRHIGKHWARNLVQQISEHFSSYPYDYHRAKTEAPEQLVRGLILLVI